MSFLHPSIFKDSKSPPEALQTIDTDTPLGRIFEKTAEERKDKYLEIIGAIIDAGFTEKGIVMFLQTKLKPLNDMSITEYLTEDESDAAHERVIGALAVWKGED